MTEPVREIVVATTNQGKLGELRRLLAGRHVEVRGLTEMGITSAAEETGATFAENARQKARHYGKLLDRCVLADDSGLQVDALKGAPGVHSARFGGVESADARQRDEANNRKLLALLADVPAERRTARFCCCLCLCRGSEVLLETQGVLEGVILSNPRGSNGFGYDPLFLLPEKGRTLAELAHDEKNQVSHRGQALRKLLTFLDKTWTHQAG